MSTDASAQRPNLLFIISDQHNPMVTGCYGDPVVQTPHLDRLAAGGVVLDNLYCTAPLCVPARMSYMTGQYPTDIETWDNRHILDHAIPTFAHALGAAGYRPKLIGRMHFVGADHHHGFAERLGGDATPNYPGGTGIDLGMLGSGTAGPYHVALERSGAGQSGYEVIDEDTTAATVDALNRFGWQRRAGVLKEPFCLTVGYLLPHQPYVARKPDYDRYWGKVPPPTHPESPSDPHPYIGWWRERCGLDKATDDEIMRSRTAYWALVDRMDAMIGQILDTLEANGLADNTLVIYTSDHGDQVGEHGLWFKQTFYEGSLRVPAILSWPGVLPAGTRFAQATSTVDVVATMVDAMGAEPLPQGRGDSLLPALRGEDAAWKDVALAEYAPHGRFQRMVRRGPWKLNYYQGEPTQLFNIENDPHETTDLAADPQYRHIQEQLLPEVHIDWNPDRIARRLEQKAADLELMTQWTRRVRPPEPYHWPLTGEMNWLDDYDGPDTDTRTFADPL